MPDTIHAIREVVAVFEDGEQIEEAANALMNAGFPERRLSLLADRDAVARRLGDHFEPVEIMEDDPRVPQRAFVYKADRHAAESLAIGLPLYIGALGSAAMVVASGGALAAVLLAAAAGGAVGSGLGAAMAAAIGKAHADRIEENLRDGGLLLWVFVADDAEELKAKDILEQAGGADVHAHEITRNWGAEKIPFDEWVRNWNPDPFLD